MTATYSKTSIYSGTPFWGKYLDVWKSKTIDPDITDAVYQIDNTYNIRPDLLAYDLYKDANLWWVFAIRNPDVLEDPLFSFTAGKIIFVPTLAVVKKSLGI